MNSQSCGIIATMEATHLFQLI